jgi:hypothetical protein
MVARLSIVLSCLMLTSLGGCSSGSQANNCIFGASEGCYCPTGQRGAQTCTSAGTFAACVCSAPTVLPDASAPAACVPGASAECYCSTGQQGAQICTSAGTFAACVCSAPTVDAGVAGGSDGAATSPRDAVAIGPSDSAAASPPDAAITEDSSGDYGMGGDQGLVVDAAAYQSADVPAVLDAAPPENDASTDASLAADRRPGGMSADTGADTSLCPSVVVEGGSCPSPNLICPGFGNPPPPLCDNYGTCVCGADGIWAFIPTLCD